MKLRLFILFIGLFYSSILLAQTTAYQTSDGNSSLFLNKAKAELSANITTSTFTSGYLHESSGKSIEYGMELDGKLTNSIITTKTPPAVGGTISIGYHSPFANIMTETPSSHLRDDWMVIRFTYEQSDFNTLANAAAKNTKQTFDEYKGIFQYNALYNFKYFGLLSGEAFGIQNTNNSTALKQVIITTLLSNNVSTQTNTYLGNYKQYVSVPTYTDSVFIPKKLSWVSIDMFTRTNLTSVNRYIEGGTGLFVADSKNPTKVLGGISLGWNNGTPTWTVVSGFSW